MDFVLADRDPDDPGLDPVRSLPEESVVSTSWEEASSCPNDGTTGKVVSRRTVGREGQLVSLECLQTRCEFHTEGWIVQIRADNTIPDKLDIKTRERQFAPTAMSATRRRAVLDALEEQVSREVKPGAEVPNVSF